MLRRVTTSFACLATLALTVAGCGGGGEATLGRRPVSTSSPAVTSAPSTDGVSYVATVKPTVTKVDVYDSPDATTPAHRFDNPWLYDPTVPTSEVPQVFLVKQQRADGWVQVLLPVRPNGSTGWVQASDLTLTANPYRIAVRLGEHTISVHDGDAVIYTGPVAVGATDPPLPDVGAPTPTPTGEYYLRVLLQAPDPDTVYGPYAYGLSSHSETLDSFAGGDAEVGIHGNDDPSALGKDVTHGCIRMDNDAITMLARRLPLGTPVVVTA